MKKKNIFVLMLVLVLGIFAGIFMTKNSTNSEQGVDKSTKINADSKKESETVNAETEYELKSEQIQNEDSDQVKNDIYEQDEEQLVEEQDNLKASSESEVLSELEISSEQGTDSREEMEIPTEPVEEQVDVNEKRIEEAIREGYPRIVVSLEEARPGDTVQVSVNLVNNPGVLGTALTLAYDETVLELINAQNGEAFAECLTMSNSKELHSGCVFLWDGEEILPNQVKDGSILNLEFKVLDDAPFGKQPISIISSKDGTVDNNLQTVYLAVDNGAITIKE